MQYNWMASDIFEWKLIENGYIYIPNKLERKYNRIMSFHTRR